MWFLQLLSTNWPTKIKLVNKSREKKILLKENLKVPIVGIRKEHCPWLSKYVAHPHSYKDYVNHLYCQSYDLNL